MNNRRILSPAEREGTVQRSKIDEGQGAIGRKAADKMKEKRLKNEVKKVEHTSLTEEYRFPRFSLTNNNQPHREPPDLFVTQTRGFNFVEFG